MIKERLDKDKDIPYEYDKVVFENGTGAEIIHYDNANEMINHSITGDSKKYLDKDGDSWTFGSEFPDLESTTKALRSGECSNKTLKQISEYRDILLNMDGIEESMRRAVSFKRRRKFSDSGSELRAQAGHRLVLRIRGSSDAGRRGCPESHWRTRSSAAKRRSRERRPGASSAPCGRHSAGMPTHTLVGEGSGRKAQMLERRSQCPSRFQRHRQPPFLPGQLLLLRGQTIPTVAVRSPAGAGTRRTGGPRPSWSGR